MRKAHLLLSLLLSLLLLFPFCIPSTNRLVFRKRQIDVKSWNCRTAQCGQVNVI